MDNSWAALTVEEEAALTVEEDSQGRGRETLLVEAEEIGGGGRGGGEGSGGGGGVEQ